ncbi:Leucine-rich repeat receptor-like serine/threonine/tyrosine-protein kinase SOBIR1 [Apostasia shenzhenica]|uniref:Leucine-rich repeat receptor-like serine/threonine/tyrosine-protein kinase SOBIR1 n=1 Tax=Apostasia shenzhenica TaxID=1088818 RepID=A0A2I0BEA7_9ASPA|nr:Leucine-rich repeat receptor-like serine/threonine/tyrosine-protein kinase SOBIR1 [Apostasia shenzhenica]
MPKMAVFSSATTVAATAVAASLLILLFVACDAEALRRSVISEAGFSAGEVIRPFRRQRLLLNNSSQTQRHIFPTAAATPAPSPSAAPKLKGHLRRNKVKARNWIMGFVVGSIAGVFSGVSASFLFRMAVNCFRGRYRNRGGAEIFSPIIKSRQTLAFLEKDDGLSDLQIIGRGGCGEVYRKEISPGGKTIAVKKIMKRTADASEPMTEEESRLLDKWMRQIRSEVRTVGRVRHRNLLPLLAHVSRPHCHYLIYEFMKNGSLHDALREAAEGRRELDWACRLKIASGIAFGLEYLHLHHNPQIIHRDLKPGNVLLDEEMKARITDFGFAKEVPEAVTHLSTSHVAGTMGYIAPEYYQTMKFTAKCDVYSFGVILGVMVTGKFPSDDFFGETEEMSLVKWIRNQVNCGAPSACFDGRIAGRGDVVNEQMELALRVACFCTADEPKDRPNSKDVRLMLAQISAGS